MGKADTECQKQTKNVKVVFIRDICPCCLALGLQNTISWVSVVKWGAVSGHFILLYGKCNRKWRLAYTALQVWEEKILLGMCLLQLCYRECNQSVNGTGWKTQLFGACQAHWPFTSIPFLITETGLSEETTMTMTCLCSFENRSAEL